MQQKVTFNSHTHAEPQAHMGGRVGLRCTRCRGDGGGRISAYVLCVGTESTFFMISSYCITTTDLRPWHIHKSLPPGRD
jgi:hypothetical protein